MSFKLGVDVGGTFTDALLVNQDTKQIFTSKVPSTPEDSSIGVINSIARVCKNAGIDMNEITQVTHGGQGDVRQCQLDELTLAGQATMTFGRQ